MRNQLVEDGGPPLRGRPSKLVMFQSISVPFGLVNSKKKKSYVPASGTSINQSKRKTSNANGQTNLGHKHKAPDHNHEATQPMVDLPHTS